MDQKDHIIDQKGLQKYEKRQKMGFSDLKYLLFNGIFLSGIGGYPPPPLNGKSSCPKTLSGMGGTPRGKIGKWTMSPEARCRIMITITFQI